VTDVAPAADGSVTDLPTKEEQPPSTQPTAPYLEAITAYGFRGSTRFHIPGHKGGEGADPGLRTALGDRALLLDVPLDIEGIDIGPSPTPYERAEQLAADAYGAERTWFLTNGATQGNHALCLALAPTSVRVVTQRNVHASMVDGLILSGGVPSWVAPEYDPELGMAHGVTPDALGQALARSPNVRAAFIVSPTYYGMAADVDIPGLSLQEMYELAMQVPDLMEGGIGVYDSGFLHVDVRLACCRWARVRGQYVGIHHLVREPMLLAKVDTGPQSG